MDGVLYAWQIAATRLLNCFWGTRVPEQWERFDHAYDLVKEQLGPETGKQAWSWLFQGEAMKRGIWRDGGDFPGGIDALRRLSMAHDVVVITKRPQIAAADTYAWFAERRFYPTELIMIHPENDRSKGTVPCDWYVDDSPANVEELTAAGRKVYLFDQPWNQECSAGIRVRGWDDLLKHVYRRNEA